jgi:hypothetical protein
LGLFLEWCQTVKDQILQRYLRYLNYAEALRVIAASMGTQSASKDLRKIADRYEQMANTLNSILRTRTTLDA